MTEVGKGNTNKTVGRYLKKLRYYPLITRQHNIKTARTVKTTQQQLDSLSVTSLSPSSALSTHGPIHYSLKLEDQGDSVHIGGGRQDLDNRHPTEERQIALQHVVAGLL